jgi:hypothetical protein
MRTYRIVIWDTSPSYSDGRNPDILVLDMRFDLNIPTATQENLRVSGIDIELVYAREIFTQIRGRFPVGSNFKGTLSSLSAPEHWDTIINEHNDELQKIVASWNTPVGGGKFGQ